MTTHEPFVKRAVRIAPIATKTAFSKLVPGMSAGKVFAIGFNKTATTSLNRLFEGFGYHACHNRAWRNTRHPTIFYKYDAFSDGIPDDFRRLDECFRRSKFILNVRDLDTWIDSRIEYIRKKYPQGISHWDPFSDWSVSRSSMLEWILQRNRYHAQVFQYFAIRQSDLITVNYIRDSLAAEKIARFLGNDIPRDIPHENVGRKSGNRLTNKELVSDVLTRVGVAESEWGNDIFCPSVDSLHESRFPSDTSMLDEAGRWCPK